MISAYAKGTYWLSTYLNGSSQKIALKNVFYLSELKRNLLSVQAMSKLGATVVFKEDECRISKDSKLIGIGTMHGKLYMLKVISEEYVNVMKKNNLIMKLWHCRFGHLGMDNNYSMRILSKVCQMQEKLICLMCVKHVSRESNTVRHILRRVPIKQLNCAKQFIVIYVGQ